VCVPIPVFPNLPENDPVEALKLCRNYFRDLVNYFSPLKVATGILAIPSLLVVVAYLIFGFDPVLSWSSDFVPLALTLAGIVLTLKKLRDQHHTAVIALLLVVGAFGTVVLHLSRTRTETAHANEISGLRDRMEAWQIQNGLLLNAFLVKPPQTSQVAELERRQNIEKVLRGEYILSHEHVSPGLLAGTEYPPTEWMNKRLHELGETWAVTAPSLRITAAPLRPAKAQLTAMFTPPLERDYDAPPLRVITAKLIEGKVTLGISIRGSGDTTAHNVSVWTRICIGCKYAKEPSGLGVALFVAGTEPADREWKFAQVYPGVAAPTMTIDVIPPENASAFNIGVSWACDECGPSKPNQEMLTVNLE
jgi:uncharacterized membrane protein YhaH (DUF805 family)